MLQSYLSDVLFTPDRPYLSLKEMAIPSGLISQNPIMNIHNVIMITLWYVHDNTLYTYVNSSQNEAPFWGITSFPDGLKTKEHRHAYIELAYVIKGNLHQQIESEDVIFHEGDICLIGQNSRHWDYLHSGDSIVLYINLQNTFFHHLFEKNAHNPVSSFLTDLLLHKQDTYKYLHFTPKALASPSTDNLLFTLVQEIQKTDPGSYYVLVGTIIRLFSALSGEYQFFLNKNDQMQLEKIVFDNIVKYIQEHLKDVTITDLQNTFHYNEDYFNRLIKKITGKTFQQLRLHLRLERAKDLIENTTISIDDISRQVGYENLGYFYKNFQLKYGKTPGKLRK